MKTISIRTSAKKYPVYVGRGLRHKVQSFIDPLGLGYSAYFIITDTNVAPLYLQEVKEALNGKVYDYVMSAGEQSKSFDNFYKVMTYILAQKPDRHVCIVALGGGVVGDLAGFVAATLLRGVGFIQMPTTVLAHDSSVGGKVAINHPEGKNLVGSFYQPDLVVFDTDTLSTLPEREMKSGFVEVIKHGMIYDRPLFDELKATFIKPEDLHSSSLDTFLLRAIQIKADIVSQDEKESGVRTFLNFGHTLGHAIEKEYGYGYYTHGEAVAMGIIFAMHLSEAYYGITLPLKALTEWFESLSIPTRLSGDINANQLLQRMYTDKKAVRGNLRFVLLKEIGVVDTVTVQSELVKQTLTDFLDRDR